MRDLSVAIIQDEIDWRNPVANRERFASRLDEAGAVDLAVLPEMFSTGFTMDPDDIAEPMDGPTVRWLREQAAKRGIAIAGSLAVVDGGRYFNRLLVAGAGGTLEYYDKRHLFRMAGEHDRYAAGAGRVTVTLHGWRIALFVCYDLRFPVFSRNRGDYDVALYVANWPAPRHDAWTTLLKARAMENQAYVIGVNRIGTDDNDLAYLGGSVVLDFLGRPLADCGSLQIDTTTATGTGAKMQSETRSDLRSCEVTHSVLTAALDGNALKKARERFPVALDADRFELS